MNYEKIKDSLIEKGRKLYLLGVKIESIRSRLNAQTSFQNLSSPQMIEWSNLLTDYALRFAKLEQDFITLENLYISIIAKRRKFKSGTTHCINSEDITTDICYTKPI